MKRFVRGFAAFWYDFLIGDDWKLAVAVVLALALTLTGVLVGIPDGAATVAGGVIILAAFAVSMVIDVRTKS